MIGEAIKALTLNEDLSAETAEAVMDEIMTGQATPVQIAAYLVALSMKGETVEEITASAKGMRKAGTHLEHEGSVFEIVGTGGDRSNSFNISTTASIIIASGGVKVAKHGNRCASSKSGAADCFEGLDAKITLEPEQNKKVLDETNLCFLFAQKYHAAMRFVGPVRKELGIKTIFNILGPLTNPAAADVQVMGVYDEALVEPMAKVLYNLGVKKGMVVYGTDRLDEISISAPTKVCEFGGGKFKCYEIKPEDFGMKTADKSEIVGGTGAENAEITKGILKGEIKDAKRDVVLLNAGCGLYVSGKAESFADGIKLAAELIDSGKALETLEKFVAATNNA